MGWGSALRTFAGYLTGGLWRPRAGRPTTLQGWAELTVEKIRTGVTSGQLQFMPLLDHVTDETQEVRDNYRKMLAEPMVKSALLTKVLSVAALDVQVHPPDKANPYHRHQAEFVRHNLNRIKGKTRRLARNVLYPGLIDGWSLNEKVWEVEDEDPKWRGKWVWQKVKSKDTRNLQIGVDEYRNVEAFKASTYNSGRVYPPADFIHYSYLDLFEDPRGTSDLRAAYRAYWIKKTTWQLRGFHLDKYTSPFLIGKYPEKANEVRAALETALVKAKSSTWLTVPTTAIIEAVEMSTRGTADFENAIRDCDRDMLVAIVGAYLQILEGKTTGARAMGEVHRDTSELFQWLLAAEFGDVLTEEARELCRLNFPDPAPPTVTLEAVSEAALLVRSQVDEALQRLGLKLSKRQTYEVYGRAEPEDDEDVLVPTTPPAPVASSPVPVANSIP